MGKLLHSLISNCGGLCLFAPAPKSCFAACKIVYNEACKRQARYDRSFCDSMRSYCEGDGDKPDWYDFRGSPWPSAKLEHMQHIWPQYLVRKSIMLFVKTHAKFYGDKIM